MLCVFTLIIRGKAKSDSAQAEKQTQTVTEDEKRAPLFSGLLCSVYFLYFCTCYGYYLIVTCCPLISRLKEDLMAELSGWHQRWWRWLAYRGVIFSHLSDKFRNSKVKVILGLEIVAAAMLAFTVLSPNTTMLMVSLTLYGLLGKMAVDPILISFVSEQASAKVWEELSAF